MSKRVILPIFLAIVAAAVVGGGALYGLGSGSGEGEYGTLYIDVGPLTGNTADGYGTIDTCIGDLAVGTPFDIDIIIDGANDLAGPYWTLYYNKDVLKVTAYNWSSWKMGGGGLSITDGVPDSDGEFDCTYAQDSGANGAGVLLRLTLEPIADGSSDLKLCTVEGDCPNMGDISAVDHFYPQVLVDDPAGEVRAVVGGACPRGGEGAGAESPTPVFPPTPAATTEARPQPTCKPTPPPPPARTEAVRYRWANVSIERPPPTGPGDIVVNPREGLPDIYSPSPGTRVPGLRIFKQVVVGDHVESSNVYVDATTGQVVHETVRPEDRAEFDAVLATLRFEGPDPPDVWPYSGTPPDGRRQFANITYIQPDPASGIVLGFVLGEYDFPRPPGASVYRLIISNGRSSREIDAETGQVIVADSERVRDQVDERDREAFDRLTASIEVVCQ